MADFHYLIVGGGMTADAAVQGIRMRDSTGSIGIISRERHPPYNRPPLSKGLWKGDPLDGIWRNTAAMNVEMLLERDAVRIDADGHTVADAAGNTYSYRKLLIATGGTPRRLTGDPAGVVYFRTLDDYSALREAASAGASFAVIGGGFIGSEIAAALAIAGAPVTMLFPEEALGARVYPADFAGFVTRYFIEKGAAVRAGDHVLGVERRGKKFAIRTAGGAGLEADMVVAGLGITPNEELAAGAGLLCENGIRVDEWLRTSHTDIFAAGDVAAFFSPQMGKVVRVEHEDNANTMGSAAGRNMAGEQVRYGHLPFFYSDLFDIGYEAVGEIDARLETVADWREEFRQGVIYYMKAGRIRGVLLVNTWGKVDAARALIAGGAPFAASDVAGLIRE